MVSAIIPAYNEEATIGDVISSVLGHPHIKEIIIVDDGSKDGTSRVACEKGVKVITLVENLGKAGAMDIGVGAAFCDTILFLDADVSGYTHEKISRIIEPVVSGRREMYVAIRARRTFWLNKFLRVFPVLGGERALTRSLWDAVPKKRKKGFEIEIALNYAAKSTKKGMGFEIVYGLRHHIKEKKYGLVVGLWRRLVMCYQVVRVSAAIYIFGSIKEFLLRLRKLAGIEFN
jgi:polyprenyl-phospho-N-acetylgalactosaminyl synthase